MKLLAVMILISVPFCLRAQSHDSFDLRYIAYPNSTVFVLSDDSRIVDWETADHVAQKLGFQAEGLFYSNQLGGYQFLSLDFSQKEMRLGTSDKKAVNTSDLTSLTDKILREMNRNGQTATFSLGVSSPQGVDTPALDIFVLSAYLQEKYPEYRNNDLIFYDFPTKDHDRMTWTSVLFPGAAYYYLAEKSPFDHTNLQIAGFLTGALDLTFMIPTFGGPLLGNSTREKIQISAIGISALAVIRTLSWLALNYEYDGYSKLSRSGYRIPRILEGN